MASQKKDKTTTKKENVVKESHINELWDVVDETQENLNFINDRVKKILNRMGLE